MPKELKFFKNCLDFWGRINAVFLKFYCLKFLVSGISE